MCSNHTHHTFLNCQTYHAQNTRFNSQTDTRPCEHGNVAHIKHTMIDANVSFILNTLHYLIDNNKINNSAKMVIISSIWEQSTRPNKLSYTISKAALSGLVKNVSYDLSSKNILINNVLPGVIDNEMSRKALSDSHMDYIKNYMNFNRLITLDDVYKTVKFLVVDNTGITGQSFKVDLGFTDFKNIV